VKQLLGFCLDTAIGKPAGASDRSTAALFVIVSST
jgi:hypothetical protein